MLIPYRLFLHGVHHLIGNIIGCFSPDINDFVVFFTLGDQAFRVLATDLDHPFFGLFYNGLFAIGRDHCVN